MGLRGICLQRPKEAEIGLYFGNVRQAFGFIQGAVSEERQMKNHVGRAILVSTLELSELEALQAKEREKGHRFANWNVLEAFKKGELKEIYHIPDDLDLQGRHDSRIDKELERRNLRPIYVVGGDDLEALHAFDWKVFNVKNSIVWDFSSGSKYGRNIKEELK